MKKSILFINAIFLFGVSALQAQTPAPIEKNTDYTYNNLGFVRSESTKMSNGETQVKTTKYVSDLVVPSPCSSGSGDAGGYVLLASKNAVSTPVETYTTIANASGNRVVDATVIAFLSDKPYPKAMYKLETDVPLTSFAPFTINSSTCNLNIDSRYKLQETYDLYDRYGNLLQKTNQAGQRVAYLYAYKGAYKTAQIVNAALNQVAYSSFEIADNYHNLLLAMGGIVTTDRLTGNNSYSLSSGAITNAAAIPATDMLVSYWRKNGSATVNGTAPSQTGITVNGWTYCEHKLSSVTSLNVSGTAMVDELRMYPQAARMETYTYLPLIGVSSVCNVANQLSFYEYDSMNRLVLIRDQNSNIVKKYEHGLQTAE